MSNDIREPVMILAKGPCITSSMPPNIRQMVGPVITETLGSCFLFAYSHPKKGVLINWTTL
jgi:hypothetical protein